MKIPIPHPDDCICEYCEEARRAKEEANARRSATTCFAFRSICEEGLKQHHWNHLKAAEEMARAHVEQDNCIGVLLEFYPEMGERTDPLSDILREIFQQNVQGQTTANER